MKRSVQVFVAGFLLPIILSVATAYADEIVVRIDGERVVFSGQMPVVIDGRVYLPARDIFEGLGFDVEWREYGRTVVFTRDDDIAEITVGYRGFLGEMFDGGMFTFNGGHWFLFGHPQIIGDRVMFPPRRLLASMGYDFIWDVGLGVIDITATAPVAEVETREIIYTLATDVNLQNMASGTDICHLLQDFAYLWREGTRLTFSEGSIYVTERCSQWAALAIRTIPLNLVPGAQYSIEITGRAVSPVPDGTTMVLSIVNIAVGGPDIVYAAVSEESPEFTLTLPAFLTETEWFALHHRGDSWFVVETNPEGAGMSYIIDSIEIRHVPHRIS